MSTITRGRLDNEVAGVEPRAPEPPRKLAVAAPNRGELEYQHNPVRRFFNVLVAGIGLVVLSPVMLMLAALVKLSSPGPVFYTQTRVGVDRRSRHDSGFFRRQIDYGGRLFKIYKFRTMRVAPPEAEQVWAAKGDARITPIGRVLRKYRLDELPQLFNVLRGDMNVVGPRPEQPEIFIQLREQVDRYQDRQRVLPGITGWAQVNQRYDSCVDDVRKKVEYDLEYVGRQSAWEDLRIMVKTLPVVAFRDDGT
ncbi:MAG: sugar transferase [Gemmatimonadota bacterium]|jgi:lipopolysaccharide/colanic/teichoic acid biosynthesis glycosyltransferase|nr:sugar transferase [Gemmatimonadota bacterium]